MRWEYVIFPEQGITTWKYEEHKVVIPVHKKDLYININQERRLFNLWSLQTSIKYITHYYRTMSNLHNILLTNWIRSLMWSSPHEFNQLPVERV